jgi:hypothetical protein
VICIFTLANGVQKNVCKYTDYRHTHLIVHMWFIPPFYLHKFALGIPRHLPAASTAAALPLRRCLPERSCVCGVSLLQPCCPLLHATALRAAALEPTAKVAPPRQPAGAAGPAARRRHAMTGRCRPPRCRAAVALAPAHRPVPAPARRPPRPQASWARSLRLDARPLAGWRGRGRVRRAQDATEPESTSEERTLRGGQGVRGPDSELARGSESVHYFGSACLSCEFVRCSFSLLRLQLAAAAASRWMPCSGSAEYGA